MKYRKVSDLRAADKALAVVGAVLLEQIMAEFLAKAKEIRKQREAETHMDPFSMMGLPISFTARAEAHKHCLEMGLDKATAVRCINEVAELLERDKPYEAMQAGCIYLDLTGVYRLFAALLAASAVEHGKVPLKAPKKVKRIPRGHQVAV